MHSLILTLCCLVPNDDLPIAKEPVKAEPAHAYRWVRGDDPDQVHLMDAGKQIGTWKYSTALYYAYDGTKWGKGEFLHKGFPEPPRRPKTGPRLDLHAPSPEAFAPGTRFDNGGSIGSDGHYVPPVGRGGLLIRAAPRIYGGR